MFTVSDRDNGYGVLLERVRKFGTTVVKVGVTDEPHDGSPGMTVADIGKLHEFGLGNNPQRSFLRAWIDDETSSLLKWLKAHIRYYLFGGPEFLDEYGKYCVKGVRKRILSNIPPPLQKATIARKNGNDLALVDSEQLLNGIIYEVER